MSVRDSNRWTLLHHRLHAPGSVANLASPSCDIMATSLVTPRQRTGAEGEISDAEVGGAIAIDALASVFR
eukprot:TRINITY_DN5735_c0_g1_i1.p2 TRINITY_DN5735_c0_g1~~TRINITY_DN5735_c0_g1_i1.p2  ORF type:complete len:70 (-),score=8.17 TRINITY_DN5735_c0_g1_i1:110-319(-)